MILSDLGATVAAEATEKVENRAKHQRVDTPLALRCVLKDVLSEMMEQDTALHLDTKPAVILVIGVNGVGKTTSIGKNALALYRTGQKGDAGSRRYVPRRGGRSARIWAKRAGADIVRHGEGADPAAVVYDSIAAAKARGCGPHYFDTAGRLHNKQNLMNELGKIDRIITREAAQLQTVKRFWYSMLQRTECSTSGRCL